MVAEHTRTEQRAEKILTDRFELLRSDADKVGAEAEEIFEREEANCKPEEACLYMAKNQNGMGDKRVPKGAEERSIETLKHG